MLRSTVNLLILGGAGGGFYSNGEDSETSGGGGKGGKRFLGGGEGGAHRGGFGGGGGYRAGKDLPGGGGVEGTPEEVEVRIKIFPVGEGEVLSTTEQISKMNVVIILLDMVK